MPTPEIVERVRDLHRQLAETPDRGFTPQLAPIQQAIDTILITPHERAHYKSLNDLLLAAYVKVQVNHPQLAAAMQAVVDSLAAAGL